MKRSPDAASASPRTRAAEPPRAAATPGDAPAPRLRLVPPGDGPFTLFAPTDRAFARLPAGVLDELLADPERLRRVLAGHLVADRVRAPRPGAPTAATSVGGPALDVTVHIGTFRVDGARVVRPHVRASNGMGRAPDTVLVRR